MIEGNGDDPMASIRFSSFMIGVEDGKEQEFIDKIEALCREYAQGQAYHYLYEIEK